MTNQSLTTLASKVQEQSETIAVEWKSMEWLIFSIADDLERICPEVNRGDLNDVLTLARKLSEACSGTYAHLIKPFSNNQNELSALLQSERVEVHPLH